MTEKINFRAIKYIFFWGGAGGLGWCQILWHDLLCWIGARFFHLLSDWYLLKNFFNTLLLLKGQKWQFLLLNWTWKFLLSNWTFLYLKQKQALWTILDYFLFFSRYYRSYLNYGYAFVNTVDFKRYFSI